MLSAKAAAREGELHAPAPAQRAHGPQQLVVVEAQISVQEGLELGRVAPDEHGVGQDDVEHGGGDGLLVVKVTGRRKMCVLCSSTLHLGSQVPLYVEFEPPHAVGLRLLSRARARAEEFARALGLVGLGIWRQEAAEVGLHAGPPRLGREADVTRQEWSRVWLHTRPVLRHVVRQEEVSHVLEYGSVLHHFVRRRHVVRRRHLGPALARIVTNNV